MWLTMSTVTFLELGLVLILMAYVHSSIIQVSISLVSTYNNFKDKLMMEHLSNKVRRLFLQNRYCLLTLTLAIHCLNDSSNLILQEAGSTDDIVSGVFTAVQSICSTITASSKRLTVFKKIQVQSFNGNLYSLLHQRSLQPLNETRWTCRTLTLCIILDNYEVVLKTLEKSPKVAIPIKNQRNPHNSSATWRSFSQFWAIDVPSPVQPHREHGCITPK